MKGRVKRRFEYDVYVPTVDNEGRKYRPSSLERYKKRIIDRFGGVTDFRHRSEGTWEVDGVRFRDEIVLLRALGGNRARAREFFRSLRRRMEKELCQKQVLIVEREVKAL